jgi:hypothetical protein
METKTNKQEIEATRVGGFGGSDAAMIYSIAVRGADMISNTAKKRLQVAKGLTPYTSIPQTDAMRKGHEFEAWYAQQSFAPIIGADTQGVLSADLARNFRTFAHADFYDHSTGEVWELKCVADPQSAIKDYWYQFQWYYMLGASSVWLVVCDSSLPFDEGVKMPVIVERHDATIQMLIQGVVLLDGLWNELNLTTGDDWDTTDLLPFEQSQIIQLANYLTEIKQMEQEADRRKAEILDFMQRHGVKSIKSDDYSIALVPESVALTFDKQKLLKDHPEIMESDYQKRTIKKPYIKVTVK